MNWEDWFKLLLTGASCAGFSILGWLVTDMKRQVRDLWAEIDKKDERIQLLSTKIAAEYITRSEFNELRREIKDEMRDGFNRVLEQVKMLLGGKNGQ